MASTATSWSPGSLQLRLALGNRNGRISSEFLIRSRFSSLNCPVRLRYVARTGERRRKSSSLIVSESAPDTLSGWSEEDGNGEKSVEPQKNKLFGGMVGAGLAGVVLFAGLAFAASSLSKRSTSRQNPKMESLTTEQGALISSDEKNEKVVEDGRDDNNVKQDGITMENNTGTDKDLSSSSENNEVPTENRIISDNEPIPEKDVNDNDNASNPEDLQPEPPSNNVSVAPEAKTSLPDLSEPEAVTGISVAPIVIDPDGSMAASLTEPTPETIKENHVDVDSANLTNPTDLSTEYQQGLPAPTESNNSLDSSYSASVHLSSEPVDVNQVVSSDSNLKPPILPKDDVESFAPPYTKEDIELSDKPQVSAERDSLSLEEQNFNEGDSSEKESVSESTYPISNENETYDLSEISGSKPISESPTSGGSFSPAGIPAPSVVSAALQVNPGKVLVPAVVDQVQGQALAALQVLKVIEADVQPSDLCTRREYARWLVSASGALSRNTVSKVYPAMYIENVTELAFDDITPEDPDFSFIQGLAEAGLISSKLSHRDLLNEEPGPFNFSPESPLSRQDLVSWKMALEKRQLPEADRKILYQLSGFIDIDKISPDAWPALVADMSGGEQGITSLAFGCTRLFQPGKPVTKAQAAIALATGEASDMVSEELARIEAESAAENAVSAHNALIAEVEKDINASFEKELSLEREKIDAVEKMAEEARQELERLRVEREGEKIAMMKERAAIDSEMEILSKLRREVEDQLESLMSNKVEISYEKERISKLKQEAEFENQEITRLQHELEVEKKALSMARSWAEEEAKRAREQAKALEEARSRWKKHGIKVEVDNDLQEETDAAVTWTNARKQISVEETVNRAETLANKLKKMANDIKGKSREVIDIIIQKIRHFISALKEWASKAGKRAEELKDTSVIKAKESAQELQRRTEELQLAVKEGAKRVAGDCREGVEKLSQKFKHDE